MSQDNAKIEELKNLENSLKPIETNTKVDIDGYRVLENIEIPYFKKLYPESWQFAYRCPTTDEIATFSTIDERDQPKIMAEISKLIRKCYIIVDAESQKQINSGQINDTEKLFFFLKLREYYLEDSPITFQTITQNNQEPVDVEFRAHNLIYEGINEKLLEYFDGRVWSIPTESFGLTEPIIFLHPTLDISDRIYKYMTLQYQKSQEDEKIGKDKLDKKFLSILPFLYVKGDEKIESLGIKFKTIQKNPKLYKAYLSLVQQFNFTHKEYIMINAGDENDFIEEKAMIKFPGGWKKMFLSDKENFGGIFG